MDSLTQIVLGAAVGEVVLGKKVGNKAMLWGAIAGTIPDLDVFLNFFVDDLRGNELHRGVSHSILFSILFAPILGWIIHKIYRKSQEASRKDWSWLAFWSIFTHPLLDCHTTFGTQLLWPLPYRVAYNNIFVVDPLYTVPFLLLLIAASFYKRDSATRRKLNLVGIVVSNSYMVWTLGVKAYVHSNFTKNLVEKKIEYSRLSTVPTPFNSILWMGTSETEKGYIVGAYSLLDKSNKIDFKEVDHNHNLIDSIRSNSTIKRLEFLSKGWYIIRKDSNNLKFNDIRFGPLMTKKGEAKYPFGYRLEWSGNELKAIQERPNRDEMDMKKVFSELLIRMKGI